MNEVTAGARPPDWCVAKRRQILDGATRCFSELGFERASVDAIAARAGVSKATLYNHFPDKKALFAACFAEATEAMRDELRRLLGEPTEDLESTLQQAGERLMSVFGSAETLALYRAAGEAVRLPGIGQMLFDRGARVTFELIAASLARWVEQGALRVDDPYAAAVQFVMLCHGDLVTKLHLGVLGELPPDAVRATVRLAVRTFLRAHRPDGR